MSRTGSRRPWCRGGGVEVGGVARGAVRVVLEPLFGDDAGQDVQGYGCDGYWVRHVLSAGLAVASAFSPKIKFRRTKSLTEGDEECDPGWGWEE
ncbi:MAG: hypothetical protein ACE5IO_10220, partial [Thermoplasmata archaeon]